MKTNHLDKTVSTQQEISRVIESFLSASPYLELIRKLDALAQITLGEPPELSRFSEENTVRIKEIESKYINSEPETQLALRQVIFTKIKNHYERITINYSENISLSRKFAFILQKNENGFIHLHWEDHESSDFPPKNYALKILEILGIQSIKITDRSRIQSLEDNWKIFFDWLSKNSGILELDLTDTPAAEILNFNLDIYSRIIMTSKIKTLGLNEANSLLKPLDETHNLGMITESSIKVLFLKTTPFISHQDPKDYLKIINKIIETGMGLQELHLSFMPHEVKIEAMKELNSAIINSTTLLFIDGIFLTDESALALIKRQINTLSNMPYNNDRNIFLTKIINFIQAYYEQAKSFIPTYMQYLYDHSLFKEIITLMISTELPNSPDVCLELADYFLLNYKPKILFPEKNGDNDYYQCLSLLLGNAVGAQDQERLAFLNSICTKALSGEKDKGNLSSLARKLDDQDRFEIAKVVNFLIDFSYQSPRRVIDEVLSNHDTQARKEYLSAAINYLENRNEHHKIDESMTLERLNLLKEILKRNVLIIDRKTLQKIIETYKPTQVLLYKAQPEPELIAIQKLINTRKPAFTLQEIFEAIDEAQSKPGAKPIRLHYLENPNADNGSDKTRLSAVIKQIGEYFRQFTTTSENTPSLS